MSYEEIIKSIVNLSYRDKFRLAQHLIQTARKEEEEEYPTQRKAMGAKDLETIEYVTERLLKSKPSKKIALENFVGAMFQFQGGISESDKKHIISLLQKNRVLNISETGKVTYEN